MIITSKEFTFVGKNIEVHIPDEFKLTCSAGCTHKHNKIVLEDVPLRIGMRIRRQGFIQLEAQENGELHLIEP